MKKILFIATLISISCMSSAQLYNVTFQVDMSMQTGFTNPAGFCVAILVEKNVGDEIHHQVIVVMGARNPAQRVDTVKRVVYNDIKGDYYEPSRV